MKIYFLDFSYFCKFFDIYLEQTNGVSTWRMMSALTYSR